MAFRNSGKSTVVGLFAAWLLKTNPSLRIMVLSADLALAKKMVRTVKRIIERHPETRGLKPDRADQWAASSSPSTGRWNCAIQACSRAGWAPT